MIIFLHELVEDDSPAAKQAKQMGLTSKGFGRWADAQGTVTHTTDNGQLVPVKGGEQPQVKPTPGQPAAEPQSPDSDWDAQQQIAKKAMQTGKYPNYQPPKRSTFVGPSSGGQGTPIDTPPGQDNSNYPSFKRTKDGAIARNSAGEWRQFQDPEKARTWAQTDKKDQSTTAQQGAQQQSAVDRIAAVTPSQKDKVKQLARLLKGHDFHYQYADDPRAYRQGVHQSQEIKDFIDNSGIDQTTADQVWNAMAPDDMQKDVPEVPSEPQGNGMPDYEKAKAATFANDPPTRGKDGREYAPGYEFASGLKKGQDVEFMGRDGRFRTGKVVSKKQVNNQGTDDIEVGIRADHPGPTVVPGEQTTFRISAKHLANPDAEAQHTNQQAQQAAAQDAMEKGLDPETGETPPAGNDTVRRKELERALQRFGKAAAEAKTKAQRSGAINMVRKIKAQLDAPELPPSRPQPPQEKSWHTRSLAQQKDREAKARQKAAEPVGGATRADQPGFDVEKDRMDGTEKTLMKLVQQGKPGAKEKLARFRVTRQKLGK